MVKLYEHVCVVLFSNIIGLILIRWTLSGVISYQLNTNARKKRKQGQTKKEWLFYTRYRDVIPKILLLLYFVILLGHPFVLLLCIFFDCVMHLPMFGRGLSVGVILFNVGWCLLYGLLFWSNKPDVPYSRWIKKKRGMPPKKKK